MNILSDFDVGPLSWVKAEVDNALDAAQALLTDWNGADLTPLNAAATHLHQVTGALQIVDLQGVSRVCSAMEGLLADMRERPELRDHTSASILIGAIHSLRGYLDGLLAGLPNAELALMPPYVEIQSRRGAEPPSPSDLFFPDLGARAKRPAADVPLEGEDRARALRSARAKFQQGLVRILHGQDNQAALAGMEEALREVERLSPGGAQYTFWWSTTALLEGARRGSLPLDAWLKRLLGRLDMQVRRLIEGSGQLAERVFRDVLYTLMQDPAPDGRVAEAHALFELARYRPVQRETAATGLEDLAPALAGLRDAIATMKTHWLRLCAGRQDSLEPLRVAATQIGGAIGRLPDDTLAGLAGAIGQAAAAMSGSDAAVQNEALQLELATALLLLQHAADNYDHLGRDIGSQADIQADRLRAASSGTTALSRHAGQPLLDEIARQAQERLLLAQVADEIQTNLQKSEEVLDRFFRNPADRAEMPLVPGLLKQIQGALNILQLDPASQVVEQCIERIALITAVDHATTGQELDWIAEALSTLGLYIEALHNGRDESAALRALLSPGETAAPGETSVEQDLAVQTKRLRESAEGLAAAADQEAGRAELQDELTRIARDADLVGNQALHGQADAALHLLQTGAPSDQVRVAVEELAGVKATPPATPPEAPPAQDEIDQELLGIYIEEAKEVLADMAACLARLHGSASDHDAFVSIRRGFHTLKGSGRMVGLTDLAEVAWEAEQTLNHWLREERAPGADLLAFVDQAATAFGGWVVELEQAGSAQVPATPLTRLARRLRGEVEEPTPEATPATEPALAAVLEDNVMVGEHGVPAALFAIFVEEASRRLADLQRLRDDLAETVSAPAWEDFLRAAHTLAGIARTTGFTPLAEAAHGLEEWTAAWPDKDRPLPPHIGDALDDVLTGLDARLQAIVRLEWPAPADTLLHLLAELQPVPAAPAAEPAEAVQPEPALDRQLLTIFLAEADELLPRIGESLRAWHADPAGPAPRRTLLRTLHTLKGSARMAGAMQLGESSHDLETRLGELADGVPDRVFLEGLEHDYDRLSEQVEQLRRAGHGPQPEPAPGPASPSAPVGEAAAVPAAAMDEAGVRHAFRAKADLLDLLINEAGEVSIARSRIENALKGYRQTAQELTANVERLRSQLRELELQAETQLGSRLSQMDESHFDPLEFDRYTRLQELTRLLAESVNDVSTAQENLLAGLTDAEYALLQQARTNRNLQQELMQIRMVRLNSQGERLHRIVRQAAKEMGRKARLHIEGGDTELDRTVLDRAITPIEHLLRNAVAHGIEPAELRQAAGKPEQGDIRIVARQEGNEVVLGLSDDGTGIDLDKVRARAEALGWLVPGEDAGRDRLEGFLFQPGFTTVHEVTRLAGRGIGLDVVRSEIAGIGGRVRLDSEPGQGTRFTIRLPSTLAISQGVLVHAGDQVYALPAGMVVLVRELRDEAWQAALAAGRLELDEQTYPLRSLAELTGQQPTPVEGIYRTVLLLRSGDERVALRVDGLGGNTEVVVKSVGPQLARLPGVAGATILGDGRVALILNPFGLMERAPAQAQTLVREAGAEERPPLVLVVDDSLTVRKITGRLLQREGYRVATAKDGIEAIEFLQEEVPAAMLLDIEMPRMDGFEVARHVRADGRTRHLPIVMITSRTADKHRQHAEELGVDLYMGKPYQEEALLQALAGFTAH